MTANGLTRTKRARAALAALLLLCSLLALGAMRSDLFPASAANPAPRMEAEAFPFALLAVAAGLFAATRRARWPRGRQLSSSIVIGLGLFVAPSLLVHFAHGWVSAFTRVVLFSLVPVFAAVFEPYMSHTAGSHRGGGLLAALASLLGMLCVFPVDAPGSIEAGAAFAATIIAAACVAAANCYAVELASELPGSTVAPMAAIAGAATALGLIVASAATEGLTWRLSVSGSDLAWWTVVTLPGLLLLFWLMPRITAVRMTTRFVLAPLMAILIGMAIDRPTVGPRIWLGLLLAAGGAAWLLFAPDDGPDANSSTLKLNRS
jgi:drug/metabolite transporter (DMT)-like permease